LEHHSVVKPRRFFYIPADVPHLPYSPSETEEVVALISRTDANEQESVFLLPEPDGLHPRIRWRPHINRQEARTIEGAILDEMRGASMPAKMTKPKQPHSERTQMRKINLFVVAAALMILAGVGTWAASTPKVRVDAAEGALVDPLQMMMNAKEVPTMKFVDHTFVFP
jgi:hypothetical protein